MNKKNIVTLCVSKDKFNGTRGLNLTLFFSTIFIALAEVITIYKLN